MELRLKNDTQERLVLENQRLIHYIIKRMGKSPNETDYEEMVSVGNIGLIKAVMTYDETKKIKLSTYAGRCIKNEILQYLRKEKRKNRNISLEETIVSLNNDKGEMKIKDTIATSEIPILEKIEEREVLERIINILINVLDKHERTCITYRILGKTQREIGEICNESQSYVSRRLKRIIKKIRYSNDRDMSYKEKYEVRSLEKSYELIIYGNASENKQIYNLLKQLKEENKVNYEKIDNKSERLSIFINSLDREALMNIVKIVNLLEES